MTNFLFKELLRLKSANNISDEVFRGILKIAKERAEDKESAILRDLFSGDKDQEVLRLFLRLYEARLVTLKDYYVYEEYLKLVILRGKIDNTSDYLSNLVVGERIFKKYNHDSIRVLVTTRGFLMQSNGEASFLGELLGVVSSMEQTEKGILDRFISGSSRTKTLLMDTTISLNVRKVLLRLVNGKSIIFDDAIVDLIYQSLLKFGYGSAEMLYVMLKDERIRNNPYIMEFLRREENVTLLPLSYIAFTSPNMDEKDIIELLNVDSLVLKIEMIQELIKKYYGANVRVGKEIKEVMSKTFKVVYNSYLSGEVREEDFKVFLNINRDVQKVQGEELKVSF